MAQTLQGIDKEKVGKAIGRISGGLYIVNTMSGDTQAGFLASWVQQAGFEPPMISVAIGKNRDHYKFIKENKKFTVNIMGKENNKTMGAFFKPPEEGKCVYDNLETFTDKSGVQILKDSVAYLECEYRAEVDSGDHHIIIAEIIGGDLHNPDIEPSTHLRADGFKY